ncbi:MAG TPA: alkaline phosphatase family protein [Jatrophihabitantaceae bacterium]|nr:alkaline phosphatase family protein [Jatrophihabitantaceae bacterium]
MIVVLENHSFGEVLGQPDAPFLSGLAASGAVLTQSYAVSHPSEPNYLALFSGSTQGVTSDACPLSFGAPNLASALFAAGRTFAGYAEGLPSTGYTGCSYDGYARKHAPWVDFPNVPAAASLPMTAFPSDYSRLPTVSFVVPDLADDMHDGSRAQADAWLSEHLGGFVRWAPTHDSQLVVTTDEDDYSANNRIATLIVGAHVRPGSYAQRVDHYSVLRWIESTYGLPLLGLSAAAAPVPPAIWTQS